jgi:hypothetical protein
MPQEIEQEAIEKILNYLKKNPTIKDQYLKFLEDSKNHYYSYLVLLDALSFIKQQRLGNFSGEENTLIRLTRSFVKTAYPAQPEHHQESQFSVDELIRQINESSPSNSPTNPDSEARMSEVGRCLIS